MTSVPLHTGTDPSNVICELDGPHAHIVITGADGELARRQSTSFHVFCWARRMMTEVLKLMKTAPGIDACELCGGPATREDSAEWQIPHGRNAVIHHGCIVELVLQRRRERKSGQPELFGVGAA